MLRAILFIIALGSGGVSAWLVSAMPADERPAAPAPVATEEVLVAAVNLEQGAQLAPEHLRWQVWPKESLNDAFISRAKQASAPQELAAYLMRTKTVAGEPIVMDKLAPPGSNFLASVLAAGKRAVAIRISVEKTAGGFVLPNDRVDVMLTLACQPEDGCVGGMTVRTILRNVRVLAIDQSGSDPESVGVLLGKTATLELEPDQAETLLAAEASGTLSLILRATADAGAPEQHNDQVEQNRTIRVWKRGVGEYVTFK